jgi:hypothetical protein
MKRMDDDLLLSVQDLIGDVIHDAEETVEQYRTAREELDEERFIYVVAYDSLWADCGEQTVECRGKFDEDIKAVVLRTNEKFKVVNKRGDVQAKRRCFVEFWNGTRIDITHKCSDLLKEMRSRTEQIEWLKNERADICEALGQSISQERRKELLDELKKRQAECVRLRKEQDDGKK